MKIMRVEPETAPELVDMEGTLEALQAAVGGYIEAVYPFDDPVAIVCNDDGKFNGIAPSMTKTARSWISSPARS